MPPLSHGSPATVPARRDAVPPAPGEDFDTAPAQREAVLVGIVEGLAAWDTADARIEVRAVRPDGAEAPGSASGPVAPDRTFRIDLALLLRAERRATALRARALHPLYVSEDARAALPRPSDIDPDEPAESRVTLEVAPASVLEGRVLESGGPPIDGAAVGLFPLGEGGPEGAAIVSAKADGAGRYRLKTRAEGRHFVVASAPHRTAAGEAVSLAPGTATAAPALLLERGHRLRGVVRIAGPSETSVRIAATLLEPRARLLDLGETRLARGPGGTLLKEYETTETTGVYEIGGLEAAVYSVRVLPVTRRAWARFPSFARGEDVALHPCLLPQWTREVEAPAEGVDFEIAFGTLRVAVVGRGRPLADAKVVIAQREGVVDVPAESASIGLLPEEPCTITTSRRGYHGRTFDLTAPGAGEVREEILELYARLPHPSLLLRLRDPDGRPVRRADCFLDLSEATGGGFLRTVRRLEDSRGDLRLADLDPGRARVLVRALAEAGDGGSFFLDEAIEVEIPDEGEASRTITLRLGGRLRIAARTPEGTALRPGVDVRGAEIRTVEADDGTVEVDRALPPGRYEVVLWSGGRAPLVVDALVEAGRTTTLRVVLEP